MEYLPNATSQIVIHVNGKEVRKSCEEFGLDKILSS